MKVFVFKEGKQYGPYSVEQLRTYVQQGNFTTTDPACFDGQNWATVAKVPGLMGAARSRILPSHPDTKSQNIATTEQLPKSTNSSLKFFILCGSAMLFGILLLALGNQSDFPEVIPCEGCGKDLKLEPEGTCPDCGESNFNSLMSYRESQWYFNWPTWLKILKNILGGLCLLVPIMCALDKKAVKKILEKNQVQLDLFISNLKANNGLTECSTTLFLDNDEYCFYHQPSNLYETKSVRHHQSSRAGFRVVKGVWIGKSQGASFSVDEWALISSGNLVITNKRLIFDGTSQNRTIKMNNIIGANPSIGKIEIVVEGRQRSMVYDVENAMIVKNIIRICKSSPYPSDFGANSKITVDYGNGEVQL